MVNCSTSNIPLKIADNVTVYPNPAKDFIAIKMNNALSFQVSILGSNGALVYKNDQFISGQQINIVNYEPGIYIMKIYNSNFESVIPPLIIK